MTHQGSFSRAVLPLNDKNSSLALWMGNMFAADFRKEDIANLQGDHVFGAAFSVVHMDSPIEYRKNLLSIIDMPLVWLVSPMNPSGQTRHVGHSLGGSGTIPFELSASKDFHVVVTKS